MTDQDDIERLRWGGPSPFAGLDTRTPAQRQAELELLPELAWAPYQEFGIPDPAAERHEAPAGPVLVMSAGYRGKDMIIYWSRPAGCEAAVSPEAREARTEHLGRAVRLLMQTDDYVVTGRGESWAELIYVHDSPPHPVTRIEVTWPRPEDREAARPPAVQEARADHSLCDPASHDRSLPDNPETVPQRAAEDGLLGCNDCGLPVFYCLGEEWYFHVDPAASCFLHGAWKE